MNISPSSKILLLRLAKQMKTKYVKGYGDQLIEMKLAKVDNEEILSLTKTGEIFYNLYRFKTGAPLL